MPLAGYAARLVPFGGVLTLAARLASTSCRPTPLNGMWRQRMGGWESHTHLQNKKLPAPGRARSVVAERTLDALWPHMCQHDFASSC